MGWELWRLHAYASFMKQDTERVRRWWTVRKSAREKTFESDKRRCGLALVGRDSMSLGHPSVAGKTFSQPRTAALLLMCAGWTGFTLASPCSLVQVCPTATKKETPRFRYCGVRSPGPRPIVGY